MTSAVFRNLRDTLAVVAALATVALVFALEAHG